jgi:hypothetical protein
VNIVAVETVLENMHMIQSAARRWDLYVLRLLQ